MTEVDKIKRGRERNLKEHLFKFIFFSFLFFKGLETMNETSVQTEDLVEDDLDWDLSDHIDRETQTFPPNATHFRKLSLKENLFLASSVCSFP